jgi:CubicO group peptidase (beta-lactamase class C family)
MSMAGLSKSRLERMHQVLSGYVERKEMPGLVALVSHHDDVHVETLGTMSVDHPAPMKRDTIFRIASLAKPITAVAAMILVEECKLRLDESEWPWTFGATKSSARQADSVGTVASAHRPTPILQRE